MERGCAMCGECGVCVRQGRGVGLRDFGQSLPGKLRPLPASAIGIAPRRLPKAIHPPNESRIRDPACGIDRGIPHAHAHAPCGQPHAMRHPRMPCATRPASRNAINIPRKHRHSPTMRCRYRGSSPSESRVRPSGSGRNPSGGVPSLLPHPSPTGPHAAPPPLACFAGHALLGAERA